LLASSSRLLPPTRQVAIKIYDIAQGGQICCCFCQAAAESLHSHNSDWSALPPIRWGNSVLCTTHSPAGLVQRSATPLLLAPHPTLLSEVGSAFQPTPLTVINYIHCLCHSVLLGGGCNLPTNCTELYSQEGMLCAVLTCWVFRFRQAGLDPGWQGEMADSFSPGNAHWDWVQADGAYVGFPRVKGPVRAEFSSIWSSVFCFLQKERKKEGKMARGFFLVAVLCQDFPSC
jgi:hypothetical protein